MKLLTNLILSASLLIAVDNLVALESQRLIGKAVDSKTGEPLYTEEHTFVDSQLGRKMLSRYVAPNNQQLGSREILYKADRVKAYSLQQEHIEYRESIERASRALLLEKQSNGKLAQQKLTSSSAEETVIDAGFNEFVVRHWDELLTGKTKEFDFVSAARLRVVGFRVKLDKQRSSDQQLMFSMTASNPIIRTLMSPIRVGFYRESRQLAYYQGISNLRDKKGKPYKVVITFEDGQMSAT